MDRYCDRRRVLRPGASDPRFPAVCWNAPECVGDVGAQIGKTVQLSEGVPLPLGSIYWNQRVTGIDPSIYANQQLTGKLLIPRILRDRRYPLPPDYESKGLISQTNKRKELPSSSSRPV